MALSSALLVRLMERLKPGAGIASFGYPDIISPLKEVELILGAKFYGLKYREDSQAICARHGLEDRRVPDAASFFALLGCALDVYDIVAERGCEKILDLNDPLPVGKPLQYDFILDVGTMEHCMNIGQAAKNMASMLKVGGFILHENPYNMGNHGFYNINPTWYADFYSQQGFKLRALEMVVRNDPANGTYIGGVHGTKRFTYLKSEANVVAVAERTEMLAIRWPHQSKYKKTIAAHAAPAAVDSGEIMEVANG